MPIPLPDRVAALRKRLRECDAAALDVEAGTLGEREGTPRSNRAHATLCAHAYTDLTALLAFYDSHNED